MSISPTSPRPTGVVQPTKPAHSRRRDFVPGCSTLLLLGAVSGFRTPPHGASALNDFMLASQTCSGASLDRHAGLPCFSHLHQADDRFVKHTQTLAWLARRNPGLDGVGPIRLLDADNTFDLRTALARLADA